METFISGISKNEFPVSDKISGKLIRNPILDLIKKDYPHFKSTNSISVTELNKYKQKYISEYLLKELGELNELETTVLNSLSKKQLLVEKVEEGAKEKLKTGQKLADKVAAFGGSWTFIISFGVFIFIWILANIFWLNN